MTDLVRYEDPSGMDTMQLGKVLAASGYFQDAKDAAQAIVKVLAGRELGIGPVASMTGIYIVKGRVTLSANVMAAQIKRSGKYNYIVRQMDDRGCTIEFFEAGQSIGTSAFTEADAKAAQLLSGDNWKKFPRNMYFSRAMSNGAKWYCPDVFSGPIYTPDELNQADGASYTPLPPAPRANSTTGEVIEADDDPPAEQASQPPNGRKRALSTAELVTALKTLWAEERGLGGAVPTADYLTDLENAPRDVIVRLGKASRERIAVLEVQALPHAPEEVDLPPITDAERAALAA